MLRGDPPMIVRSPSESFLLYLLVAPGNNIDTVVDIATRKNVVYLGRGYLERLLRENRPPKGFAPTKGSHAPSVRYLFEHGLFEFFNPNDDVRTAFEILDSPQHRELVEAMHIARAPLTEIRDALKARFRVAVPRAALRKYILFFWDVGTLDRVSLRALLDLQLEQLRTSADPEIRSQYPMLKRAARHDPRRVAIDVPAGNAAAFATMAAMGAFPANFDLPDTLAKIRDMSLIRAMTAVCAGGSLDGRRAEAAIRVAQIASELRSTAVDPGDTLAQQFKQFALKFDAAQMKTIDEFGAHTVSVTPDGPREEAQSEQEEPEEATGT